MCRLLRVKKGGCEKNDFDEASDQIRKMIFKRYELLPKTSTEISNGGIYRQLVRCGKKGCKCARGEMHEAYYFMSRCYGRQVKTYVPRSEVERIRELVIESRYLRWRFRNTLKHADEELKQLRQKLREARTLGKLVEFVKEDPSTTAF